jgi:hypothetical protein
MKRVARGVLRRRTNSHAARHEQSTLYVSVFEGVRHVLMRSIYVRLI